MEEQGDILIFDTGGGSIGTIAIRARYLFEYTNQKQRLLEYQDKSEVKVYPIVNAVMKIVDSMKRYARPTCD